MSTIKKSQIVNLNPNAQTRSLKDIADKTGNLYLSLNIIGHRANQISIELKEELLNKLEEFAPNSDNLEEVFENREQIEISRYYEKLPNPCILATQEFFQDEIYYRNTAEPQKDDSDED
jgi:DNA-directed RNA polymerase subunit K/omega